MRAVKPAAEEVLALRQVLRERGSQPLDFGALRASDELAALERALASCLAKKGTQSSLGC